MFRWGRNNSFGYWIAVILILVMVIGTFIHTMNPWSFLGLVFVVASIQRIYKIHKLNKK